MMTIKIEPRGKYDKDNGKDALVVFDPAGQRIALFIDPRRKRDEICIAVSLPDSKGTRCYAVGFAWMLDHLRNLEPQS